MSKVSINESTLTAIGNAIREKTGKTALIAPGSMPTEIANIQTGGGGGIPEEALIITGDCSYRFANNGWNWFIEEYGNRITTKDITNLDSMFHKSAQCTSIPFVLQGDINTGVSCDSTFFGCQNLSSEIKFKNISFSKLNSVFNCCYKLKTIVFEDCDFSKINTASATTYSGSDMFNRCESLRHIPEDFLKQIYNLKATSKYYLLFQNGFYQCYGLDEIRGISPRTGTLTSNVFTNTFNSCARVLNIVFDTQEDGTPYIANWKSQTIDLSTYVGYVQSKSKTTWILLTNAGITEDKEVIDDATYQALKNDPDWFTCDVNYSRYNHDSAVETINSLPDTSASGGTNIIKFTGDSGTLTDGGAINTLTEEEIAVAAAKGWTVTLV